MGTGGRPVDAGRRRSLEKGIYVVGVLSAAILLAVAIDRFTPFAFVQAFVIFSGLGGLLGLGRELGTRPRHRGIDTVLDAVNDDDDGERVAEEKLGVADIVSNEPGQTTLRTLMEERRSWTLGELVERTGRQLDGDEFGDDERYADLHATLFAEVLPEMDRQNIATFERETGLVEITDPGYRYGQLFDFGVTRQRSEKFDSVPGIGPDELFPAFESERRAKTLTALARLDGEATLAELVDAMLDVGIDDPISAAKPRASVRVSLEQTHLVRLDDAGLVRYVDAEQILLTTDGEHVHAIMAEVEETLVPKLAMGATAAYGLLKNQHRRCVLELLADDGDERPERQLVDLAAEVAAAANDTSSADLESSDRKRAYVSLFQVHLPRLADEGALTFDTDDETVRLRSEGRTLCELRREIASRFSYANPVA